MVALDIDLQGKGTHCTHCLRVVDQDTAVKPENDRLKSVYCSKDCEAKSKAQSDNLLFGLEPVLPAELDSGLGRLTQGERDKAQTKFVSHLESQGKLAPLLVARFVARQVAIETGKMNPHKPTSSPADLHALVDGEDDYGLYDHMERLRFIEANPTEEDTKVLCDVLATALPGLDKSLEGQHSKYLGKMNYNAFGVVFENGRDDKVSSVSNLFLHFVSINSLSLRHQSAQRIRNEPELLTVPHDKLVAASTQCLPTYVVLRVLYRTTLILMFY